MVQAFEQFIASYPSLVFEKGQTVLLKDEVPKGTYIIESGIIKTYTINEAGEERIVSIDNKGEDIPIGFTIGLIDRCQYFYEAYTRCTVRVIPCEDYLDHMQQNHDSLFKRHVRLTKILLTNLKHIEALEQSKASEKVARTLLYMADTLGSTFPNKTIRKLTITQQEIANALGLTRETAGIVLKKLELKKLLNHSRNTYILYVDRLHKYIDKRHDQD
ncbi:MAG: Transcriptional regulatory protein [Candidatus Saccharibacteria bacterium]|nr:Transcriptional regulatory protein [Candidatus Saccharibacteria bacterium]MDB5180480.1 Transcriptional regulatory protein [Candidatus Saccharibacteria bacterium]